jgi:hypothetical protein
MKENAVSNAYMFIPPSASGRMSLNKLRTLIALERSQVSAVSIATGNGLEDRGV